MYPLDSGFAKDVRRPLDLPRWHASHALHPVRPVAGDETPHGLEARGPAADEIAIDEPVLNCNVENSIRQGAVGTRRELEMERRELRRFGPPRVGDDEGAASVPLSFQILHDHGEGFGRVAADHHDRLRFGDILHRERHAAIETESPRASGRRRCHAEAAIVIDVRRPLCDAREFA
jgi:hypothetical protein